METLDLTYVAICSLVCLHLKGALQNDVSCNCELDFSALELLLIKKRVKGPCWLSIAKPQRVESSSQVLLAMWTYFNACNLERASIYL